MFQIVCLALSVSSVCPLPIATLVGEKGILSESLLAMEAELTDFMVS